LTARAAWPDRPSGGKLGDGRFALATFRPPDLLALCQTVREQVAHGHGIYPQGGKTALNYGGRPGRPGVAIDTTAISQLIDYPFADMTITVQAGMTLSALRQILAEQHQRVLVDAPDPNRATLGGIFATNTSGPRRYAAGRPRDQIIGVSFVTSLGVEVKGGGRVVKNVAGYDFPKLLTGSMGALGIITQMTLKVRPIPEASAVAWVAFRSLESLADALEALNTSGTRPIALELLNAPASRALARLLGLPAGQGVLAIGYEDNAGSVRWQLDRLKIELGRSDFKIVEGAGAEPIWHALTEFQAAELGPVSFVANLRPSSVVSLIGRLDPERWSAQAHAGNGIVRAHALGDWALQPMAEQLDNLRRFAVEDGGNLIVARAPTEWKDRLQIWGEPRADWALGEGVKAALDPHGAMNPGRFVGRMERRAATGGDAS
jgi:glycolate oxidase FAD binding subunit